MLTFVLFCFNSLRNFPVVFQGGCIILYSQSSVWELPILHVFSNPCSLFGYSHPSGYEAVFVVLISLMIDNVEHFIRSSCWASTYLPSIHLLCSLFYLLLSWKSSLYVLDMSPLSDRCFTNIFSQGENFLCGFSFHFCLFGDKCVCVFVCFDEVFFFFKVWSTDLLTKRQFHMVFEANTAN